MQQATTVLFRNPVVVSKLQAAVALGTPRNLERG